MAALRQHALIAASEVVSGAELLAAAHSRRCLGPRLRRRPEGRGDLAGRAGADRALRRARRW
jgi:hypothetical protein